MIETLTAAQIGARAKLRREELNKSQSEMAKELRVSQNTIQKIENGRVGRSRFLSRYWQLLGYDLAEIDPKLAALPIPKIGYAPDPIEIKPKIMSQTEREAELLRHGYELGRQMASIFKAKRIQVAVVQAANGGEPAIALRITREDDSIVEVALPLDQARLLSGELPRILREVEAMISRSRG